MALRLMQIFLPDDADQEFDELLEGREVIGRWRDEDAQQIVLHLLVPAEETEPIMDRFEERYADLEGFHVILSPVEAVLPRPEAVNGDEDEEEESLNGESEATLGEKQRISREELYTNVVEDLGVTSVFLAMTFLSAIVAAVGLIRDDVAVIIGAMVIAPLLTPNVALSLATTLGDWKLMRRAFVANVSGVVVAFVVAVIIGLIFGVDPDNKAIAARTNVNLGDILLALAAGAAGTLAFTRGLSGAVIGVMVAVALMPPLVACGMLIGSGQYRLASGAMLLTVANVISVNLAGVGTFLIQGVRPRSWWEAKRAKTATRRAIAVWIVLLIALALLFWFRR
ncbi:hypothetical protein CA54_45040 [Symmachiella macrocystis]|uniref:TIGR00341 family protein n=1 Tax=Symmachiella macrocystis TaxID=2527985 RepID=A0A5C6BFQ3_9PLAN|nr:TIGR00341 family protein [Symmachiella macrocystis]TWU09264.1 hypothetical protein CA54_45040 [Symmachiella macrocystis]